MTAAPPPITPPAAIAAADDVLLDRLAALVAERLGLTICRPACRRAVDRIADRLDGIRDEALAAGDHIDFIRDRD